MARFFSSWIGIALLLPLSCVVAAAQTAKRVTPIAPARAAEFSDADTVGVAVLVGVGKYPKYSRLSELHYPSRDVDLLAASLKKQRYIVLSLKDGDATKGAVLNAIKQAGEALAGENLNIVFFFSGHGFAVAGENYLATLDATGDDLAATGLSVKSVERALEATKAPRRVMWLDACRDEPSKGVGETRSFAGLQTSAGTRALLSTRAGKVSYEDDELRQGMFSYYLVKGLEGEAAGPDGLVTFHDLAAYVTSRVRARGLETGHVQVPYEGPYEASGDFLLAKAGVASAPTTPGPATENQAEAPSSPQQAKGPDAAQAQVAINQKFETWGATWMMDRYVAGSAQVDQVKCGPKDCVAEGKFSFMRMGAIHNIGFGASIVAVSEGKYAIGRLCYSDNTTNMKDCTQ